MTRCFYHLRFNQPFFIMGKLIYLIERIEKDKEELQCRIEFNSILMEGSFDTYVEISISEWEDLKQFIDNEIKKL